MSRWSDELVPLAERVGLDPAEIAALCLLRRRGDVGERDAAFDFILDELFRTNTRDPLVVAALISLFVHPNPDTKHNARLAVAEIANDRDLAGALEEHDDRYQAIRLACSHFPGTLSVIIALGPADLVAGLTRTPHPDNPSVPRNATEGEMGPVEPISGQVTPSTSTAETGAVHAGTQPAATATPTVIRVGFVPYLRAMWNIFWSSFRHPTKTTEIDLKTGRVVRHF
jgi:hypothetical protein